MCDFPVLSLILTYDLIIFCKEDFSLFLVIKRSFQRSWCPCCHENWSLSFIMFSTIWAYKFLCLIFTGCTLLFFEEEKKSWVYIDTFKLKMTEFLFNLVKFTLSSLLLKSFLKMIFDIIFYLSYTAICNSFQMAVRTLLLTLWKQCKISLWLVLSLEHIPLALQDQSSVFESNLEQLFLPCFYAANIMGS